jgi:hypothetical protein
MKTGTDALGTAENVSRRAKQETGSDTLGTAENESGSRKHENGIGHPRYRRKRVRVCKTRKRDPTPSVPPKTCPDSRNMKMGPDALGTAENEFRSAKYENGTRALDNEFGCAKQENGT